MLLVILVTIGLILYFDVLNPIKFVPEQCEFGEQIKCVDMYLNETTFLIKFQNNFPKAINITDAESREYPNIYCDELTIQPSETGTFGCNITDAILVRGEKKQISLKLQFQRFAQGSLPPIHELRGVFVTAIE
ncbi:MAG: hypothetical protein ABIJ21_00365 [Nanoarchaeota archaeon]